MKGYGKRFASSFGRNAIQQTVTYGLDEAFDLDTGFQRSSREGVFPRVKHAFRNDHITNEDRKTGALRAATRGCLHRRHRRDRDVVSRAVQYKDGLRIGTGTLITSFGINLVREFFINW